MCNTENIPVCDAKTSRNTPPSLSAQHCSGWERVLFTPQLTAGLNWPYVTMENTATGAASPSEVQLP